MIGIGKNDEVVERRYIPPFELKGILPNVQLDGVDPEMYKEVYARYIRLGDKLEAFVDVLTGHDAELGLTVNEHLALSRTKIDKYTKGRNLDDLIEIGAYIGPCVVAVCNGANMHSEEFVRLGLFIPNPPRL